MSTATMDAPSTPMQVEVDVSIGSNAKDTAKAEEASAKPADKRECACVVYASQSALAGCILVLYAWISLHPSLRYLFVFISIGGFLFAASRSEFSSHSKSTK